MDALALPGASPTARAAHQAFAAYLARTKNTICGRHPIGVLLGALAELETTGSVKPRLQWVRYEQSSECETVKDSSVSYASAFVQF
jgi:predicted class III extradiol MEMO1 family dioxygenase